LGAAASGRGELGSPVAWWHRELWERLVAAAAREEWVDAAASSAIARWERCRGVDDGVMWAEDRRGCEEHGDLCRLLGSFGKGTGCEGQNITGSVTATWDRAEEA
jgi:hypothetical protein